jgi:DNA adenine methylase
MSVLTKTLATHTDVHEPRPILPPPLKWAGGKRWLVPRLQSLWREVAGYRLVEPFAGGLSVALGLRPDRALLNDVNRHLIHFYHWLQRGLQVETEMVHQEDAYYCYRDRFNELIRQGRASSKEAAELFYYFNRTGYNGLCRFNKKGEFNVPFGRYKTIRYVTDLTGYVPALANWQFTCEDFEGIRVRRDDFVYADPPYDVEFTSYCAGGFDWGEQVRLAHWLAAHPGPVVASNQATQRILSLYGDLGFTIRLLNAPRRISCNGDRTPAREMLATKGLP